MRIVLLAALVVSLACAQRESPNATDDLKVQRTQDSLADTSRPADTPWMTEAPGTEAAAASPNPADSVGTSPGGMPRNATARCGDSTWSTAARSQGACSRHGGVETWFGSPPAGATARCRDGTYSTSTTARGTCSGHGGVLFRIADPR
jgi:hypothetical protein